MTAHDDEAAEAARLETQWRQEHASRFAAWCREVEAGALVLGNVHARVDRLSSPPIIGYNSIIVAPSQIGRVELHVWLAVTYLLSRSPKMTFWVSLGRNPQQTVTTAAQLREITG